ncbi:hypothetical protein ABZ477_08215 [Microbacterium sp. NPDC019599]|uniref:hypothetical protein n=1 Tax=Microbacterium sp. NPDC019599 TaxID=3154690 RepID=UPI00340BC309
MRRSPLAAAAALALLVPLSACAPPGPEASPTVEASSALESTSGDSQPSEVLLVPGGERPPLLADGDCSALLGVEELSMILEVEVEAIEPEDERSWEQLANIGGISCRWSADDLSGGIQVAPRTLLEGVEFPAESEEYYFERCEEWACSWRTATDDLWVSGTFSIAGMTREAADALGAEIADLVASKAQERAAWERETEDWWPRPDCSGLAARVAERLGLPLDGVSNDGPYIDPPMPAVLIADEASRMAFCAVFDEAGQQVGLIQTNAGMAWTLPEAEPSGTTGVSALAAGEFWLLGGIVQDFTDGTNLLRAEVSPQSGVDEDAFFAAVASAVADL